MCDMDMLFCSLDHGDAGDQANSAKGLDPKLPKGNFKSPKQSYCAFG